ncbi:MAG TPA: HlyD family efflux transporter periplasmic adaptor subunit [Flavobacteriales bacterium]|nr:HlyD family efflux transporter periplasmic adaptor subunit [Flavobacteriales bacterium]
MKLFLPAVPFIFLYSCGTRTTTVNPVYMPVTEAVYASGNIYPENEYKVYANADGILLKAFVAEGDSVRTNQVMFHIENEVQDVRSRNAAEIYSTAVENYGENSPALMEMKSALHTAKTKLANDSLNFTRYEALFKKNATSQSELDRMKLAYTSSRNDYEMKKNALQKLRNQLFVELQNAETQYRSSSIENANFSVKSLLNGMVYEVYKKKGESVRRGEPVALIGDSKRIYARLVVDELDVARIKKGQQVLIRIDYDKEKIYKATVSKIYPKLSKEDQSFRVDAVFNDDQPPVLYGLTLEANIVISEKSKALTIPKSVIQEGDSVLVLENGEERKIKIKRGIENLELAEVVSGLTEKSEIIVKK